jgi:methionyl-tRNA synthetase
MLGRYTDGAVPTVDPDPVLAADFDGLVAEVSALLDEAEITQALERIWQRVRRLNRYVEETAPWQLAKDPEKTDELQTTLRSLAEGLRVVGVLLTPYIPESTEKLLAALGAPDISLDQAEYGAHPGGQPVSKLAPLFPKPE